MIHPALPRHAHANAENGAEFIPDVCYALTTLPGLALVVLVVHADRGCGAWKRECRARELAAKEEKGVNNSVNSGDEGDVAWKGKNVEDETRPTSPNHASGNNP